MARSVPTSLAGVTHYGDLGVNFNQGSPVYVTCRGCASANFNRGCPSCVLVKDHKEDDVLDDCAVEYAGQNPNAVNVGPEPDARTKPNAVNAGPKPDARTKPNAVNAGPEPDAGLKPNVVNARPKPDAELKPKSRAVTQCWAEAQ
ncbi:hypothetical protein CRG98_003792 [Punica granatum]|uniref:Uncharacterized protein n=1 Tax=Punica granatum TaxID=22663 RepID=A0A2I0L590_PUNGR|nr:hypothetical protein CRG98_003792 [Punica granatum]